MIDIIPRGQWGMPGPLGPPMRLPARTLYVHHSVTPAADGAGPVRAVAHIGIQRFGRASYSYAVTPDGTVYGMQGGHVGAHTGGQNSTTFGVVLVGNYDVARPTGAQLDAVARLHRRLVADGTLVPAADLLGHRDAPGAATACPGLYLYAALPSVRARAAEPTTTPTVPEEDTMMIAMQVADTATVYVGVPGQGPPLAVRNPAELQRLADLRCIAARPDGKPDVWTVQRADTLDYYFPSGELIAAEVLEAAPVDVDALAEAVADKLAARLRE